MEDRRLSWPRWLATYQDGLPTRRWSPIQLLTAQAQQTVTMLIDTNALSMLFLTIINCMELCSMLLRSKCRRLLLECFDVSAGTVTAAAATTADQSGGSSESADRGARCVDQSGRGNGRRVAAAAAAPRHRDSAVAADNGCRGDAARRRPSASGRSDQLRRTSATAHCADRTGEVFWLFPCPSGSGKSREIRSPLGTRRVPR